jgi:hypothetical protein
MVTAAAHSCVAGEVVGEKYGGHALPKLAPDAVAISQCSPEVIRHVSHDVG